MELGRRFTRALVVATLGAGIAACGDDAPEDGDSAAITSAAADAVVDTAVDTTQNQAPVITGALNPTAIEGQLYEFTPRASDPDGDTLTFSIQGKPDWLAFDTRNGRLSGTPGGADIGSYAGIVISVSDGELGAELAPAAIDVIAASASGNSPPSISGTPADSVIVGQFYDFIPFASDPDGDSLNFEVQNLPAWADFYAPTGRLSGTPGAADVGTYGNIVISVDDGIATRTLDPFVIVVNPDPGANRAPVISGQPAPSVLVGGTYAFIPTATDADGDSLSFSAINLPDWALFDPASGALGGVPGLADVGVYSGISVVVSDGQASAALASFSIAVVRPNSPPTIGGTPAASVIVADVYSFVPVVNDADGDVLSFSVSGLPAWASFNPASGALTGVPAVGDAGTYSDISITVTDGEDQATLGPFSIEVVPINDPPLISGTPASGIFVGDFYDFVPVASDPDGDPLIFTIQNLPAWASFDAATGRLSGTPSAPDVGTYGNIVITADDGTVASSLDPFVIVVNPEPVTNSAPTISGTPAPSVLSGASYSFTPTAADVDGDPLTFSIVNQPSWAAFDPASGTLSGVPAQEDDGIYSGISIVVSDGEASTALPSFQIEVIGTNSVPTITGTPPATVIAGDVYSFEPVASDADGDRLTFSVTGAPSWMRFKKPTGALNGVPKDADAGVYSNISITVTDGEDSATLGPFSVEVIELNVAPEISGVPASSVTVGESFDFTPVASDANGDTLSFSIANQPGWASFSTVTGQLSGSPAAGDEGTYGNIIISVSDGAATSSLDPFSIVVNPEPVTNTAPTISGTPATSVLADEAYSFTPTAADADGDALTFSVVNQPSWASFDTGTGTLSGIPGAADDGVYSGISIVVSDGEASTALTSFSIEVVAPNTPPLIGGTPEGTTVSGDVYTFVPVASDSDGGSDPLTFSIVNQPSWTTFNTTTGALTGVPDESDVGVYSDISITVSDGQDSSTLGPFSIVVEEPNVAPEILGIPSESVTIGETYSFTPTASDANGDTLSFSIANQPGWASFSTVTGQLSGAPVDGDEGTYGNVIISVTDGVATSSLDAFSIVVNPEPVTNTAPTISGTPATSVLAGEAYSFTPTAADVDGDPLTFSIVNQPAWASFDTGTGTLSGVPDAADDGLYTGISIVVSDGEASTALPNFRIEVIAPNTAPVIGGTPASTVTADDVYSFVPTASDADGDTLSFSIVGKPAWASFNTTTGALNGVPKDAAVGVYSGISITVSDGEDTATLGPFSIEVLERNVAPAISGVPAASVTVGEAYSFTPVASDANGDTLSFSISNQPVWASFSAVTGQLSGAPVGGDEGTYGNIVISVTDGVETAALDPFVIVVNPEPVTNTAPTISGTPAPSVLAGASYSFTPTAADADGDPLTFSVVNQPSWASFDTGTGTLSGVPDAADDGLYTGISIVVSDGEASTALPNFRIEVIAPNTAPVIGGTPATSVTADDVYSFVPTASDADGDTLSFSIVGKPSWASFNTTTGALNGSPDGGDVGIYSNISITVSDGEDAATLGPFSIEVLELNVAPEISGVPAGSVTAGETYSFTPVASDANGDTLSFSIANQPAWASFSAVTGQLSGAPVDDDAGNYGNIVISVSDGVETASLAPFVIVVNPAPVSNTAPTISGTPATSVLAGEAYSFTPTASDVDDDPLTFSIVSQPAWASFDPATGTLSGVPDALDAGTYSGISIVVSDGEASTALPSFRIEVIGPNTPPTISGTPAASVLVGDLYSFVPTASDADGDALTFSIAGKPSWAGFNTATGALTGVPSPANGGVQYNNITITVSDGEDSATLGPFSIEVIALNTAPTIGGTPASSVVVGQTYSFTPTAIDVDGDALTFSVSGKPSWASFNAATGALTGTPTAANVGIYNNIRITVTDGEASATLGPFSIEVEALGVGSATLTWTPPTENSDGSALTDLAGYIVYWGTVSGSYDNSVTLNNAGLTSYVVENLASGTTYHFATTAYNSEGVESNFSNEASKTIP